MISRPLQIALLLLFPALCAPANAQNFPLPVSSAPQVPEVGDADLAGLQLSGPGAISLRATLSGLRANPGADARLKSWVARGNVVFLHTNAARSFGFATVPLRPTIAAQGGQEFVRTRPALPFAAHPLLRGDVARATNALGAAAPVIEVGDVARLPGVSRVFGSLRDGDSLVIASNVATPLLLLEDVTGQGNAAPQFAAAITSLGAGWAIFCPDEIDLERADGAAFARALAGFVPDVAGQKWVGVPTRTLLDGTMASLAEAVDDRLSAANASNGTAALPAFGTNATPVLAPPVSEPTLPISRDEAASLLSVLRLGGVRASARVALLQARLALQNGDAAACANALEVAAVDPALGAQIDFWNAALNAQLGADPSLPAAQQAALFDLAAQALARSATLDGSVPVGGAFQSGAPFSVSTAMRRTMSQRLARLSAIAALSPPLVRTLVSGQSSASIRFFPGDGNALALEASVLSLLNDTQFGWRAPHVEVVLLPSANNFFALRRALGRADGGFAPDGDQIGQTIVLASGASNLNSLKRLWSRVLISTWTDDARALPGWLSVGLLGVALGGNSPAANVELRRVSNAGALSLFEDTSASGATPLGQARSTALVEWIYSQFGEGTGSGLVAQLAAGRPADEAISDVTGESLEDLNADWTRFLRG